MPFTYVLTDDNGKYYIGSTTDLQRRLREHLRGHTATTRRMDGLRIAWQHSVETLDEARRLERKIKCWKSRKMIELLIAEKVTI